MTNQAKEESEGWQIRAWHSMKKCTRGRGERIILVSRGSDKRVSGVRFYLLWCMVKSPRASAMLSKEIKSTPLFLALHNL